MKFLIIKIISSALSQFLFEFFLNLMKHYRIKEKN